MAPPAPPSLARGVVLMTAADSAAALQASATAPSSLQLQQSSGVVTIHAGETAVVRVVSVSTSRCETVGVSGVITQALFSAVGSCGGVGLTAIIGPASTDGSLLFALTTSSASQELVEGAFPNYTVRLDDGLLEAPEDSARDVGGQLHAPDASGQDGRPQRRNWPPRPRVVLLREWLTPGEWNPLELQTSPPKVKALEAVEPKGKAQAVPVYRLKR